MKKYIFCLLSVFVLLFVFLINPVKAASSDFKGLSFKLSKGTELGSMKYITIEVTNDSSNTYSFGWVDSCRLEIITDKGSYIKKVSSGQIKEGTKSYDYFITNCPGNIKSIKYENIMLLDSNGLPKSVGVGEYTSSDFDVYVSDYYLFNGVNILIAVGVGFIAFIILVVILKKIFGSGVVKFFGILIFLSSLGVLGYAGYNFIFKPVLGQADFMDVAKKYWYLWIVGMILLIIGSIMMRAGRKSRRSYYNSHHDNINNNNNSELNDFMRRENDRLFNEQVQRDMEENQRINDQFNQQQMNDMNNFNNNNMNNMF